MIEDKKVLAIIPARGGSKSLPRKNILPFHGKPLIVHTIEAALRSKYTDRVLVTTDNVEIADIAKKSGADVPFLRPAELARDDTPPLPVSQHAVRWLELNEDWTCDIAVELQPVAPLRTSSDIDAAISKLVETGSDSVISLCRVDGAAHPYWMKKLDGDRVLPLIDLDREFTRRQDLPPVYRRNGSIAVVRRSVLIEGNSFYGGDVRGYIMPEERSVDIDTAMDFKIAEAVLSIGDRKAG